MSAQKQQPHSHFLVTLTGCMLLFAGSAAAHPAVTPGENIRHTDVLTRSLDGEIQNTFRKIRHLVSFFLDKDVIARAEQPVAVQLIPAGASVASGYASVFSYKVRHVKNRAIRSWLLRV